MITIKNVVLKWHKIQRKKYLKKKSKLIEKMSVDTLMAQPEYNKFKNPAVHNKIWKYFR